MLRILSFDFFGNELLRGYSLGSFFGARMVCWEAMSVQDCSCERLKEELDSEEMSEADGVADMRRIDGMMHFRINCHKI